MAIGRGFFSGLITGLVWGAVWMLVIGIIFMLISGAVAVPPIGAAAIAGMVSAGLYMALPPERRRGPLPYVAAAAILLILLALTAGRPMGLAFDEQRIYQLISLAAFAALTFASITLCLNGVPGGHVARYQLEELFIRVMKGLGFVVFTVLVALPFYVMVMTSLKSQRELIQNPLDYSIDLTQGTASLFRSYIELFTQYHFGTFLLNSAFVSICTVIVTLAFSIPGAYAVARLRFPGQAFLSQSILLIYMVPAIILVIPLYAVFSQLGLRDTLVGLLIVYPATTIPVAVYMLQGYFRGLPSELEEAGMVDGLTRIGVILRVTLPLSLPALASVALYVFMIAWNEFLFAFMFLDNIDFFTLSRGVVSLNSSEVPRQHLMAGAVVATVPVLFLFLYFERYLVAGLTAGSVKG